MVGRELVQGARPVWCWAGIPAGQGQGQLLIRNGLAEQAWGFCTSTWAHCWVCLCPVALGVPEYSQGLRGPKLPLQCCHCPLL